MNVQMLQAEVKTNESYTFTFSKPVQQYMVGFSRCIVGYDRPDHHVRRITIDLTDSTKSGNQVVVRPQLKINDSSNHRESSLSRVQVIVIATIGNGNPELCFLTEVESNADYDLPGKNPTFVKPALTYSHVEYSSSDHHVHQYSTVLKTYIEGSKFSVKGTSHICDIGRNKDENNVKGSVLIYSGSTQYLMCADFDSKTLGDSGTICVGQCPEAFQHRDYDVACFIDNYEVSFDSKKKDHHVLKVELDASLTENHLIRDNDKVYARIALRSFLTDNGENPTTIPHNSISGFVVAFRNK